MLIMFYYFLLFVAFSIFVNLSSIPVLNGSNFKEWKDNIQIVLGCMDLDLAFTFEQPNINDTISFEERRHFEKWDR